MGRIKIAAVLWLLLCAGVLFSAAADKKQKIAKCIKGEWRVIEIAPYREKADYPVTDRDLLVISEVDDVFNLKFGFDSINYSGTYLISKGRLIFTCNPADTSAIIDSGVYKVISTRPEITFYSKGEPVTRLMNGTLRADTIILSYDIIYCEEDSLVLADSQKKIILDRVELVTAIAPVEKGSRMISLLRGLLGLFVILGLAYLFSANRKAISWRLVTFGILSQMVIAFAVLKLPFVQYIFEFMGKVFIKILDFSKVGGDFLFESMVTGKVEIGLLNFAFQILPTIIFFSALTSILFYYGIIQKVVYALAWLLKRLLRISGAESLSACGNIFVGQTEAPLLIKEYLAKMNRSEIMLVMTGGMATIAGGVLAIYIGLLGGVDPAEQMLFAKHLISASVMAAPGAVVAAKMLVPQTEPIESEIRISRDKVGSNFLEAITNGTGQGVRLAVNVAAMLLVFIALIAMVNFILQKLGDWTALNGLIAQITNGQYDQFSMQFILGYALAPLTWIMGVCTEDIALIGQLLGEKTILNEMIAFISLRNYIDAGVFHDQKSIIMATYMLCGFANFSSIGIQLGGIGALAPSKKTVLSQLGFRALVGGTIASLLSATIVGIIVG